MPDGGKTLFARHGETDSVDQLLRTIFVHAIESNGPSGRIQQ